MSHYIGIDVSCKFCAICAVGAADGKIKARGETETTVEAIHAFIKQKKLNAEAIGLETGAECHHLARGLKELGHTVEIIEARKSSRIISMLNANKNDPNDAFALAQLLRSKFYTSVRVKAPDAKGKLRKLEVSSRRGYFMPKIDNDQTATTSSASPIK